MEPLVEKEPKSNKKTLIFYITLFLITGTCSLIFGKLLYQTEAINYCLLQKKAKKDPSVLENLTEENKKPPMKVYFMVLAPAFCDFLASFIMFVGLLWIPVSIWQMIRGSILIFTGIFRITWLKKPLLKHEWIGLGIIFIALVVVGVANIFGDATESDSTVWQKILGFVFVFIAQGIQAFQTVYEEYLLQGVEASSNLIVGMEGVWGFILTTFALIAAYFIPGEEGNGLHEDFIDALYMCKNNGFILTLNILSIFVLLLFNLSSMRVTKYTNSVVRNLLEPCRTFLVWVTVVVIHWFNPSFGEGLNYWSLLQLLGFIILTVGLLSFNNVIKYDRFSKKDEQPAVTETSTTA
ncbi:hypothetical protein WA158_001761 [Blastocystis sp. Blastoise]